MTIDEVFGTQQHITGLQECARAVLIFLYGLLLVRIAGRRIFGRWAALDIVVAIMIGSNLSRALTGSAHLFGTLEASTLLVALHWALARAVARSRWWSRLLEGEPVPLATDGQLDARQLARQGLSRADLNEALRGAGIDSERSATVILLEPSGRISVLKRQD